MTDFRSEAIARWALKRANAGLTGASGAGRVSKPIRTFPRT
jgi:hypothetical protein